MKYTTSLLFPLAGLALAVRDCTTSDQKDRNEGGNSFCGAVDQIVYSHFIRNGSFQAVTDMSSGCQFKEETFEGPLATFDKDVSAQSFFFFFFPFYVWGSSSSRRIGR